jgi:short-subunit dehydrogenase
MLLKDKMKSAVIIGASSGIGRALAMELVRDGYRIGITGRRAKLLAEIVAISPENFVATVFDATAEDAAGNLENLIAELDGIDLFVFCAGTGEENPKLDPATEEHTNRLNVDAFTRLCGTAYNFMQTNGGGHLAAITSVMGLRGSGTAPAYAASKAYQINYLEGLRQKSVKGRHGITVMELRPGSVDTNMMKGEGHFWIATPERAAATIMKALRRRRAVQYVTPRWALIGRLLKWMPRAIYNRM